MSICRDMRYIMYLTSEQNKKWDKLYVAGI